MHRVLTPNDTTIHKFGANPEIDTGTVPEDIWDGGGAYPFPSAADTTTIVSSSTADDAAGTGARTVQVFGLDANWADIEEVVTMDGTSAVTLTNDYLRVFRTKVLTAGSSETNVGTLTIQVGGTTVGQVQPDTGQSLMAIFTSAAGEKWQLLSWYVSITGKTAGVAEIALQTRVDGGAWQTKMFAQVTESNSINYTFPVPQVIDGKTDVRVRALDVGANDTAIGSTFGLVQI